MLTQPGSVFVFRVLDAAKAKGLLALWQRHGLALSTAVKADHGHTWQDNPYIPQNGYGEVAVNPNLPFALL